MTPREAAKPTQFIALAALRGVAALVVVQWHGKIFLGGNILPAGYLAVDFFFLLSGWVLAHAYDRRLDSGMTARQFLRVRLIRLYPVYLLALGLASAIVLINHEFNLAWLLASLLFLPDFWEVGFYWMIPPTWSLLAEIAVNAPFALLHKALGTRTLAAVAAISLICLVATANIWGNLDQGHSALNWYVMLPRVFFSFPLGVLLYRHRKTLAAWAPSSSTWPAIAALLLLLAIPESELAGARDLLVVAIGLPAVLLLASSATPARATAAAAAALGALSYPLYLLHVPLFDAANMLIFQPLTGGTLDGAPVPAVAGFMLALLAISWLIDRYFDVPIRGRLNGGAPPAADPSKQSA